MINKKLISLLKNAFSHKLIRQGIMFAPVFFIVIGGNLAVFSNNAWAAEDEIKSIAQNKEKEINVITWAKSYGKKVAEAKKSDELKKAQNDAQEKKEQFYAARDKILSQCKLSYTAAVKKRLDEMGKSLDSGDVWDVIGDGMHTLYNLTGLNLAGDKAKSWLQTDGVEDIVSLFANVAYTSQVDTVRSICNGFNVEGLDKQLAKLQDLGQQIEDSEKQASVIEKADGFGDDIYEHCYKQKDGKIACVQFVINEKENTVMSITGVTAGCMPLPFKLYEARSCLFCPLFKTIFDTIQIASSTSFANLAKPMAKLILIGLAIWIALMVLQNVSSMTRQDPFEFVTKLLRNSFKVIIAYLLLKDPVILYSYIIGPLLKAGFEFGAAFLSRTKDITSTCSTNISFTGLSSGVFPGYLQKYLLCFIEAVQYELATSQAIGSSLMCVSRNAAMSNLGPIARVMPDFMMMFQGALIYIISLILSLAYAFYLVDATIQLGIFGILLPFIILCMPFKITNSYYKTGVGVFMNSWFVYVFMGIVVNIVMQLIGQSLTGGKGGLSDVEAAINGNEVRRLQELLGIGFAGFLVLLACCIFGVKLMMKVTDLAGQFSGGGLNLGIGSRVGALGAQAVTGVAKAGVKTVKNTASGVANMKVFGGEDGKYHSLNDGIGAARNAVARGAVNTVRGVTHAIFHPQKSARAAGNFINKMRGKERREPSE